MCCKGAVRCPVVFGNSAVGPPSKSAKKKKSFPPYRPQGTSQHPSRAQMTFQRGVGPTSSPNQTPFTISSDVGKSAPPLQTIIQPGQTLDENQHDGEASAAACNDDYARRCGGPPSRVGLRERHSVRSRETENRGNKNSLRMT